MLNEAVLEKRLETLEQMVADLQRRLDAGTTSGNWLAKLTGSISDQTAFLEALEYGKALRQADRPPDDVAEES